jgi:hypothetical protein
MHVKANGDKGKRQAENKAKTSIIIKIKPDQCLFFSKQQHTYTENVI